MLKDVKMPIVEAGDFIQFRGVGAYTICLTPTFINFLEPILMEKMVNLLRLEEDKISMIY